MNERDTPRTDAAEITISFTGNPFFKSITYVTTDFARGLERELNQTISEFRKLIKEIERHCPCGARPESLHTHPHVGGCPVGKMLVVFEQYDRAHHKTERN